MSLLMNAVNSIQMGVEDYKLGTAQRILSAVRNIHSGVLLLYKEALRRRSPAGSNDVLVKAHIQPQTGPSGELLFVGTGRKTVDVQQIKDRFGGLGIHTDWILLDKITEARNNLEHYVPNQSPAALEGLVANAFALVRDFLARELKEDPLKILGQSTWQTMLDVSDVYNRERQACEAACASMHWQSEALESGIASIACADCGCDLLCPVDENGEIQLRCCRCGAVEEPGSYVPTAIAAALDGRNYVALKEGDQEVYTTCPECNQETYVMEERKCALCQHEAEHTCGVCGDDILASELMCSPMCSRCEHRYQKMLTE